MNFLRGFATLPLMVVPLIAATPAQAAQAPQSLRAAEVTTLADAVGKVPVAPARRRAVETCPAAHCRTPIEHEQDDEDATTPRTVIARDRSKACTGPSSPTPLLRQAYGKGHVLCPRAEMTAALGAVAADRSRHVLLG
jgi:hypothetical protein